MTRLPNRFPGVPETEFYKEQREDLMVKAVRSFWVAMHKKNRSGGFFLDVDIFRHQEELFRYSRGVKPVSFLKKE
mgnify:CR=1 FL=1